MEADVNDQNRYRGNSPQRNQNEERGSSWNRQQESSLLDRGNSPRGRSGTGGELSSRSGFGDDFDDERSFREQDREYRGGSSGYGRSRDYQNESTGFGAQGSYYGDRDRDPSSGTFSGRSSSTNNRGSSGYGNSGYGSSGYGSSGYGSSGYGSSGYGGASSRAGAPDESGWSSPSQSSFGSREYRGGSDRGWNTNYQSSTSGASYAGRGPKGYTRSDERIREDVCERLSEDDQVDASDIEVRVTDRKVTLTGSVENRRMKHVAEDIAEAVSGVDDVDNQVTVRKPFLKDMADRISGNDADQHHANSGTKNSPASGTSSTTTSSTTQNASARS